MRLNVPIMVNGLHLYSAFIQSALQFMPLIHPFTHTFTHQRRLAAMQGTNQFVRSNWGLGVLLRDTSTCPGWDRTSNPLTARRQLLPPEPHRRIIHSHSHTLSHCLSHTLSPSLFHTRTPSVCHTHTHTHTYTHTHTHTH